MKVFHNRRVPTWLGVGGRVEKLVIAETTSDIEEVISWNQPIFPMGNGSNIIIRDQGLAGVCLKLGGDFNVIEQGEGQLLKVGAATLDKQIALYAAKNSLADFIFLAGIPGTIGGAIPTNAGAYGKELSDILVKITAINLKTGSLSTIAATDLDLAYRSSNWSSDYLALYLYLQNNNTGLSADLADEIQLINEKRSQTQIASNTAGSTFKNPLPHKAWQLIEASGARGLTVAGAKMSEKHCNFIEVFDAKKTTARDIEHLVDTVKQMVQSSTGITLEPEIKFIG